MLCLGGETDEGELEMENSGEHRQKMEAGSGGSEETPEAAEGGLEQRRETLREIIAERVAIAERRTSSRDAGGRKILNGRYMKLRSIGEGSASKVFLVERIADGNSQAGRPTRELTGCLGRQFYAVKVWRRSRLTRVSMGASHTASAGIDAVMRELSLWSGLECDR